MAKVTDQHTNKDSSTKADDASHSDSASPTRTNANIIGRLELTPTVIGALKQFPPDELVSAVACTQVILDRSDHRKAYAGGLFTSLELKETDEKKCPQVWLDEVQTLFDSGHIQTLLDPSERPVLHGRLAIIGLSLLEPQLHQQFEVVGAFTTLEGELRQPLSKILSERGRELYESRSPHPNPVDSVFNWGDDPLRNLDDDLLGRAAFARFLARRIESIPADSGAYALHVYGPWGAGKSTLLNFVREELQKEKNENWQVVGFNAWRNQHIKPPWWSLLESVFQGTKKHLSWPNRLREYWWRLSTGRTLYLIGMIVLLWFIVLIVLPLLRVEPTETSRLHFLATLATNFDDISKLLALVTTIWGIVLAVNRSLLFGSARAAQNYTELTYDPASEIKKRFEDLIQRLNPKRAAIFIDDLDRCQADYVVDLLEGIQTLFRDAPAVFLVAADRHWLNACYEQVYERMKPQVSERGKTLGALFLEKAFRFTTPMPGIPDELKRRYWLYLLQVKADEETAVITDARARARDEISKARSEEEVHQWVESSRGRPFIEQRALREEAAVRMAEPEIVERLEHTLEPYAMLLEPNPRAMKRLVNTYSASRALAILSETEIERHQLVLWIILSSRWPRLTDALRKQPEMVEKIGQPNALSTSDRLASLVTDPTVVSVVRGGSINVPLTAIAVKNCIQMQP